MTSAECAARYVRAFQSLPRGGQKAVVRIHDNLPGGGARTTAVLDALVGTSAPLTKADNPVRVAHPRCIVGCTR